MKDEYKQLDSLITVHTPPPKQQLMTVQVHPGLTTREAHVMHGFEDDKKSLLGCVSCTCRSSHLSKGGFQRSMLRMQTFTYHIEKPCQPIYIMVSDLQFRTKKI